MFVKRTYHNPNEYTRVGLLAIPQGDHRVKIINVVEKNYGRTGLFAFEITLKVSGRHGLLWYRLILDPKDEKKSNKKLYSFFRSFNITDYELSNYKEWIGKQGAVRVMHATDEATGFVTAFVYFCLSGWQQDALPPFKDVTRNVIEDMNKNLLVKYLDQLCRKRDAFEDYYKLITVVKYRGIEQENHCFISDNNLEHLKQVAKEMRPGRQMEIKIIVDHIDRNIVLARKLAQELLLYDYSHALRFVDKELQGKVTILNYDSVEEFIRTEEEYRKWQEEERKEWEEAFARGEH